MEGSNKIDKDYLLLVEDGLLIQTFNKQILTQHGYSIQQAYTLEEARAIIKEKPPIAIILDIQLPDGSGLDLLSELRQTSKVPVLLLTSFKTAQDIIRGLEAGADDYITKPYEGSVFLMRVKALLRRASLIPEVLKIGPIKIDVASKRAYLNDVDMGLQQKELLLLEQFAQYPKRIMSAEHLYVKAWGYKMAAKDNSLKVAISKLRTKLINSGYTITASKGEGYYIEELEEK